MNVSFLQELLNTVAEQGRHLIPWGMGGGQDIVELSRALMSGRGEASGVAIAREILQRYRQLTPDQRKAFFVFLAEDLLPNESSVRQAAEAYLAQPEQASLGRLQQAVESPRQEFFRRLNLAPGGTAQIVALRTDVLQQMHDDPRLAAVDADLRHLLGSWFNRGFLVLRRIDWQTPAAILEKIIAYEAVHAIDGWDDLRRRLDPADRRCYAFFHPALVDEPLIFVEVALMGEIPTRIDDVLGETPKEPDAKPPTTAVFYSISNCQQGLAGITFGNFLIKQVVEVLVRERPSLGTFVTLSPVPGFAAWLQLGAVGAPDGAVLSPDEHAALAALKDLSWINADSVESRLRSKLRSLAARYFIEAKTANGRPLDPVARFHLGNGARLERINWPADTSDRALAEAHGLMVNYQYDLKEIERNHEAYANEGRVVAARSVHHALRQGMRRRPGPELLEPPAAHTQTIDVTQPVEKA